MNNSAFGNSCSQASTKRVLVSLGFSCVGSNSAGVAFCRLPTGSRFHIFDYLSQYLVGNKATMHIEKFPSHSLLQSSTPVVWPIPLLGIVVQASTERVLVPG